MIKQTEALHIAIFNISSFRWLLSSVMMKQNWRDKNLSVRLRVTQLRPKSNPIQTPVFEAFLTRVRPISELICLKYDVFGYFSLHDYPNCCLWYGKVGTDLRVS